MALALALQLAARPRSCWCIAWSQILVPTPILLLPAGAEDGDHHHLFAGGWGSPGRRGAGPQQVELMERSAPAAAATYIEDRLRRRGRTDSQQDDAPTSSSQGPAAGEPGGGGGGARGAGAGADGGHFALLHHRPALFGAEGAALVSAGGRQLTQWKDTLLKKLKKVGGWRWAAAHWQ